MTRALILWATIALLPGALGGAIVRKAAAKTDAKGAIRLTAQDGATQRRMVSTLRRVESTKTDSGFFRSVSSGLHAQNVTIIMADNRSLFDPKRTAAPMSFEGADWMHLAAITNFQYAKSRGYGFKYVELPKECAGRHNSWCKLLLIQKYGQKLPPNELVVFLDSDAIFIDHDIGVDEFINQAPLIKDASIEPSAYLFTNSPWTQHSSLQQEEENEEDGKPKKINAATRGASPACAGVQIWRTPIDTQTISAWWNMDVAAREFPWEQAALDRGWPTFHKHIAIIDSPFFFHDAKFIRHVCHACKINHKRNGRYGRDLYMWENAIRFLSASTWDKTYIELRDTASDYMTLADVSTHDVFLKALHH